MKNITLSADERIIAAARKRAQTQRTTLNSVFRKWLTSYANPESDADRFHRLLTDIGGKISFDRRYSRDERNER